MACTDNDGINGVCGVAIIGANATISEHVFATGAAVAVRTDTRIDPHTLYKLTLAQPLDSPAPASGTASRLSGASSPAAPARPRHQACPPRPPTAAPSKGAVRVMVFADQ